MRKEKTLSKEDAIIYVIYLHLKEILEKHKELYNWLDTLKPWEK